MTVHHCPKCELTFSYKTELDWHTREDHDVRPPFEDHPSTASSPLGRNGSGPAKPRQPPTQRGSIVDG
jgi:hypothetical protein